MKTINWLFTLSSLSVLLVTIERFSFTTKILLQPYDYLRLHEVVQMLLIILITVVLPFFLFREVSDKFKFLQTKKGLSLFLAFFIGVYFYATGNGVHEVASFAFNNFCGHDEFSGFCGSMFFNDYYFGNFLYFAGGLLMNSSILLAEKQNPNKNFNQSDFKVLVINGLIYSLAIFAYSGFDRVLVGLIYSIVMTVVSVSIFIPLRKNFLQYPVITYTTLTYLIGTIPSILIRLR